VVSVHYGETEQLTSWQPGSSQEKERGTEREREREREGRGRQKGRGGGGGEEKRERERENMLRAGLSLLNNPLWKRSQTHARGVYY
jgi:hypothetical protein